MNEMTALANIERRIAYHIQGIYANALEVGRCLIEAKELVPHGDWEEWIRVHADMSDRTAQRLMQAAREVPAGSSLEKLPISKIQAILALPEPEREAVAAKAVTENQSLRELKETIARQKREIDEAKREAEKNVAIARKSAADARKNLDIAVTELNAKQTQLDAAREQLREALDAKPEGISEEAQRTIGELTARLEDAETLAAYQAREREKAQKELLDVKSQLARGERSAESDGMTAEAVVLAVRTFIGSVGYLPHSARLQSLAGDERRQVAEYAGMVAAWAAGVTDALAREPIVMEV